MDASASRTSAQQRADRIRAFRDELAELNREGALELTPEQAVKLDRHLDETLTALAARFDVDTTASQKQVSWGMRIATAFGGLALSAAVVLFFYRIWGGLTTVVQVGLVALAPILSLAAAEWRHRKEKTPYYTALLSLLAVATFILNLSVLGTVFNLAPTPNALLAWGVFAVLLAYRFGIRLLLAGGIVLLDGFVAGTLVRWQGGDWFRFLERPEIFAICGVATLAIPLILPLDMPRQRQAGFRRVFELTGLLAVLLAAFLLSMAGESSYLPFGRDTIRRLYEYGGLLMSGGFIWRGIQTQSHVFVNGGSVFFALFLLARLSRWLWDLVPNYLFFLIVGLIAVGMVALFKRLRNRLRPVEAS